MPTMQRNFPQRTIDTAWYTLKNSFTDLNYYVEILNTTLKRSLKIVFSFYLLLGIPLAILFSVRYLQPAEIQTIDAADQLIQNFPEDLEFTWNGSQLSSNASEPLVVNYPENFEKPTRLPEQLAIIDTSTNDAPPENTPALLYINQESIFANSTQGNWSKNDLTPMIGDDPQTLNKQTAKDWQPQIEESIRSFFRVLPFFAYLMFSLGMFAMRLIMIAIDSIIVQFLFTIMGKKLPYKKAFQLSLHLLIPVEILYQLSTIFYPQLDIPMINLAYWSLIALLLWHLRNLHVVKLEEKQK